ncbi:CHAT domain-containing protein [Vannielia litorea]|uniref:CHAT domain-containing tetratricopeptide repeat protein n=1 Tax=Vannielia litorea TaxID=1217970 RepID=UPI001C977F94|nr:CHAT domain-containing protein [Vannielia litorea]MBY6152893.1 CHAT domain-containing protein [Vannielia litorea]
MKPFVLFFCLVFAQPVLAQSYSLTPEEEQIAQASETAGLAQDFAEAERLAREVVSLLSARLPENHPMLLFEQLKVAELLATQRRLGDALEMKRDIHSRFRTVNTVYMPLHAAAQMSLVQTLTDVGNYREALPLAVEAVTVAEADPNELSALADSWRGSLATIFYELGYLEDAEQLWARSIAGLDRGVAAEGTEKTRGHHPQAIVFAEARANALSKLGRADEAVTVAQDAIARRRGFYGRDEVGVIAMSLRLAQYQLDAGDKDGMHATLEAMGPAIEAEYKGTPIEATALALDALWWLGQGFKTPEFMKGLAMLEEADTMFSASFPAAQGEGFRHPVWGKALLNLAAVREHLGEVEGALEAVFKAEALGVRSRETILRLLDTAGVEKVRSWGEVIPDAFRVAQVTQSSDATHALLQMAARVSLGNSPGARLHRAITDAVDHEAALQADYAALVRLPMAERDAAREIALKAELSEVSLEQKRLRAELHETAPDFAALVGDGSVEQREIQSQLGPEEAVVLFDIGPRDDDNDFVFIITNETTYWLRMPVKPSQLSAAVADVRAAVDMKLGVRGALSLKAAERESQAEFPLHAASWLYGQTFGQFEWALEGKNHIYLELRGPLTALPPHLLIRNQPETLEEARWMVQDYAITVIPSVFALKAMEIAATGPHAPEPILGVANPIFDPSGEAPVQASSNRGGALSPLPETFGEVQAVAGSMGSQTVWQQAEASEAAIKGADLERFKVLYFATHGLVSGDEVKDLVVQEPALALTPGDGEDGLLTASEIAHLRMNPDWVVLSACNTAVGDTPGAEALSGLAQSFLYAGARALLVSHWPVESQSAVSLMTDIFARRANDPELSAAEAQRQAMLAMIDGPRPEWRHPAYWAPFILVGDPDR